MAKKKPFQTHELSQRLISAGFSEEQADGLLDLVVESMINNQITKHDLKDLYTKVVFTVGAMMVTSSAVTLSLMAELLTT